MSHNQIVELESELSRLKTEMQNLDIEWSQTKNQLLDEIRGSQSIQITLDLVNRMNVMTLEYTRKRNAIELILIENRETYFKTLQQ
jgi:hypothetical protein